MSWEVIIAVALLAVVGLLGALVLTARRKKATRATNPNDIYPLW